MSSPNLPISPPFEYCDIRPWVEELSRRMEEARAMGTNVVNLSYTHPRGFFPLPIVRRPAIREMLKTGWTFVREEGPPTPHPERYFIPEGWPTTCLTDGSLVWCDTKPFEDEIERRHLGERVADLTGFHPRGAIPDDILKRIQRRKNPKWREEMSNEIEKLRGQANKDEAFATTQESRAEGQATKEGGDPTALLRSAAELRARAEQARQQVKWLSWELTGQAP